MRLFYGPGFDRILGNDKGVGVAVFTDRKVTISKDYQKAKYDARVTLSERATPYWVGKAKFGFLPVVPLRSVSVEILKIGPETILTEHR